MKAGSDSNGEYLIFTCAGAAHSGQVANRSAVYLTERGAGRIFCLAAVSGRIPDKLERTARAGHRVAIDGCDDHGARLTLEREGFPVDTHVVVTDLGVEKQPGRPHLAADAHRVADAVAARLGNGTQ